MAEVTHPPITVDLEPIQLVGPGRLADGGDTLQP